MAYTNQQIINEIKNGLNTPRDVYNLKEVNYRGKSKDGQKYTELIAEHLCKNISKLELISCISRDKSYKVSSHHEDKEKEIIETNRTEEIMAKKMHNCSYKDTVIGEIVDYQVPLKNIRDDKGVGKIDLLAKQNEVLTILELKKFDSDETLLRAVLEAYTYFKIVDQQKLLNEYKLEVLEKAVLIHKGGKAHMEYLNTPNSNIKKLISLLDVKLFAYTLKDIDKDKSTVDQIFKI